MCIIYLSKFEGHRNFDFQFFAETEKLRKGIKEAEWRGKRCISMFKVKATKLSKKYGHLDGVAKMCLEFPVKLVSI